MALVIMVVSHHRCYLFPHSESCTVDMYNFFPTSHNLSGVV